MRLVDKLAVGVGVQVLLEGDAELLTQGLELIKVLLVLTLVLNLGLDTWMRNSD